MTLHNFDGGIIPQISSFGRLWLSRVSRLAKVNRGGGSYIGDCIDQWWLLFHRWAHSYRSSGTDPVSGMADETGPRGGRRPWLTLVFVTVSFGGAVLLMSAPASVSPSRFRATTSVWIPNLWGSKVIPYESAQMPPVRPLPASDERTLTSAAFKGITAHSLNPPTWGDAAMRAELQSRLVIIVGMGVHSGSATAREYILAEGPLALPLFAYNLYSFFPVAQPNFVYR